MIPTETHSQLIYLAKVNIKDGRSNNLQTFDVKKQSKDDANTWHFYMCQKEKKKLKQNPT